MKEVSGWLKAVKYDTWIMKYPVSSTTAKALHMTNDAGRRPGAPGCAILRRLNEPSPVVAERAPSIPPPFREVIQGPMKPRDLLMFGTLQHIA